MGPGSGGEHVKDHAKDQMVMGDSNAGVIAEVGWTGTGKDVSGAGAKDRAGVDESPCEGMSVR